MSNKKYKTEHLSYKSIFFCRNEFSRVENHKDLVSLTDSLNIKRDDPVELTMRDSEILHSNASCILLEFGANINNLIHCKRGTKVILLIPDAFLDFAKWDKHPAFLKTHLEPLIPLMFLFDLKIVAGKYNGPDRYQWISGTSGERTKCLYDLKIIKDCLF